MEGERIAKVIAASGYCSRRDAEKLISSGMVAVDGKVIDSPAFNVTDKNAITIEGKLIGRKKKARVFLYHKPAGLVTTHKDEKGRPTVFSSLPATMPRVVSVGRLDLNSEGLLILTTDGELAREMELPSSALNRTYRVRVFGHIQPDLQKRLGNGVVIDGITYGSIEMETEKAAMNSWLKMTLTEGKNREIRKVLEHFGLKVNRLIRISYGQFELGDLKPGELREVTLKRVEHGKKIEPAARNVSSARKKPRQETFKNRGQKAEPALSAAKPQSHGVFRKKSRREKQ